jgi:hypothetical protein
MNDNWNHVRQALVEIADTLELVRKRDRFLERRQDAAMLAPFARELSTEPARRFWEPLLSFAGRADGDFAAFSAALVVRAREWGLPMPEGWPLLMSTAFGTSASEALWEWAFGPTYDVDRRLQSIWLPFDQDLLDVLLKGPDYTIAFRRAVPDRQLQPSGAILVWTCSFRLPTIAPTQADLWQALADQIRRAFELAWAAAAPAAPGDPRLPLIASILFVPWQQQTGAGQDPLPKGGFWRGAFQEICLLPPPSAPPQSTLSPVPKHRKGVFDWLVGYLLEELAPDIEFEPAPHRRGRQPDWTSRARWWAQCMLLGKGWKAIEQDEAGSETTSIMSPKSAAAIRAAVEALSLVRHPRLLASSEK